jgi:hypothetical protein
MTMNMSMLSHPIDSSHDRKAETESAYSNSGRVESPRGEMLRSAGKMAFWTSAHGRNSKMSDLCGPLERPKMAAVAGPTVSPR